MAQQLTTDGGSALAGTEGWATLVVRARSGERSAARALFDQFHTGLFAYLLHLTGERERAVELTQETFVRALSQLPRLRDPQAFVAWLYRIARNLVRDADSRPRTESLDELDPPDPRAGVEAQVLAAARQRAVDAAIAALSPEHREVVVLHHLQGLDVAAIATIAGCREGTVKSRLARAREVLRRRLAPWLEAQP